MKRLWLASAVCLASCQPHGNTTPLVPPTRDPDVSPLSLPGLRDLVGGWGWVYTTDDGATSRLEQEQWRFREIPGDLTHLAGRYVREVTVTSTDRTPFGCNQRTQYRQRAVFDVTLAYDPNANTFAIHETGYRTEPSPCDHGFRHPGDYTGEAHGGRMTLTFPGGTQTLLQVDASTTTALPEPPWPQTFDLAGPWRWANTSYDADGNLRDETEWWEITARTPTTVDATYRRRVTTRSIDGKPIPCAHGTTWSFDDVYVLSGNKEEEHWHVTELAADPGDHACLKATPRRTLDEATLEQLGDYLVVEWRGKRREVLYRPAP